jgi:hypothetical protein
MNTKWVISQVKASDITHSRIQVEMAGIEPASERLDPQVSTSVAGRYCRQTKPRPAKDLIRPSAEARRPLFRTVSGVSVRHSSLCVARSYHRTESGAGGRGPVSRTMAHSLA